MLKTERYTVQSYEQAASAYIERGWTDGLPIVPPTPEKVEQFLDYSGLPSGQVLGTVPTREVTVTAEHVAINSVMAGCKPEYMPVVVAAVRAILEKKANLHATTATLAGAAHAVILNGPIRKELGINCGAGCFGPGWQSNATIGRALRLVIRNVCESLPGQLDRAVFSTPARYSLCFGENEEDSPWAPLHVERGFPLESSTVTVHSVMFMQSAFGAALRRPEGVLDIIVRTIRSKGIQNARFLAGDNNVVVVVGMEHMRILAGWSKKHVREYMYPRLTAPLTSEERNASFSTLQGTGKPEGILIVAAGGPGMAESWILHPHHASAITVPIETPRR